MFLAVPQQLVVILPVPSNEVPLMLLAVVNFVAEPVTLIPHVPLAPSPVFDGLLLNSSSILVFIFVTTLFCIAFVEVLLKALSTITFVAPVAIPASLFFSSVVKSLVDNPLPLILSTFALLISLIVLSIELTFVLILPQTCSNPVSLKKPFYSSSFILSFQKLEDK